MTTYLRNQLRAIGREARAERQRDRALKALTARLRRRAASTVERAA